MLTSPFYSFHCTALQYNSYRLPRNGSIYTFLYVFPSVSFFGNGVGIVVGNVSNNLTKIIAHPYHFCNTIIKLWLKYTILGRGFCSLFTYRQRTDHICLFANTFLIYNETTDMILKKEEVNNNEYKTTPMVE